MQRLLIASDLGPRSDLALQRAVRLATSGKCDLKVVYTHAAGAPPDALATIRQELDERARAFAKDAEDLRLTISMEQGLPEDVIAREAQQSDPDLILLGSHGEPRIRDAVFGTTATHLIHAAKHPVLVVQNEAKGPYSRVMLGVDEALTAQHLLLLAADVAPGAELFAVQAYEPSLGELLDRRDIEEKRRSKLLKTMNSLAEALPHTPDIVPIVEQGDAMTVLERNSRDLKPDLVLIGDHERSALGRFLVGSHADDMLLWSTCDVLVTPMARLPEAVAA